MDTEMRHDLLEKLSKMPKPILCAMLMTLIEHLDQSKDKTDEVSVGNYVALKGLLHIIKLSAEI